MEEDSYNSDLKMWGLIGDLHHKMFWLRQKELSQYGWYRMSIPYTKHVYAASSPL